MGQESARRQVLDESETSGEGTSPPDLRSGSPPPRFRSELVSSRFPSLSPQESKNVSKSFLSSNFLRSEFRLLDSLRSLPDGPLVVRPAIILKKGCRGSSPFPLPFVPWTNRSPSQSLRKFEDKKLFEGDFLIFFILLNFVKYSGVGGEEWM